MTQGVAATLRVLAVSAPSAARTAALHGAVTNAGGVAALVEPE